MTDDKTMGIQPQKVAMIDGNLKRWLSVAPTNALLPSDPSSLTTIRHRLVAVVAFVDQTFDASHPAGLSLHNLGMTAGHFLIQQLRKAIHTPESQDESCCTCLKTHGNGISRGLSR